MAMFATDTYQPENLIAGNAFLLVAQPVTIAAGHVLQRGTVLGKISASGEYLRSDATAIDGSEVPDLVLAEDVDTTETSRETIAYSRGDFIASGVLLGEGHTPESVRETLRMKGIFLIPALEG